jgi:hypothetical protein
MAIYFWVMRSILIFLGNFETDRGSFGKAMATRRRRVRAGVNTP